MLPEEGQGLRAGDAIWKELLHFASIDVLVSWAVLDHVGDTQKPQPCAARARAEDGTQLGGLRVGNGNGSSSRGEGEVF